MENKRVMLLQIHTDPCGARAGLTSSLTMMGHREVRCCGEMRSRRTRNIRKIWAETAGVWLTRRDSLRRSGLRTETHVEDESRL